jgi:hypothetical protein
MEQIEYADMVAKLRKPGDAIVKELNADDADLLHMTIGLVGEASGELLRTLYASETPTQAAQDMENIMEELGDIEFYLEGIRQCLGLERSTEIDISRILNVPTGTLYLAIILAFTSADQLLDHVKKKVIYRKPLDMHQIREALAMIEFCLFGLRNNLGLGRDHILQLNMDKLAKRYPGYSYSNASAQARADKLTAEAPATGG